MAQTISGLNGQVTYAGEDDKYPCLLSSFNGENGLPYRTVGGTEDVLDPLIDLNLHGDYYFSGSFGAFVEVNNLLGNNRERWAQLSKFWLQCKSRYFIPFAIGGCTIHTS